MVLPDPVGAEKEDGLGIFTERTGTRLSQVVVQVTQGIFAENRRE